MLLVCQKSGDLLEKIFPVHHPTVLNSTGFPSILHIIITDGVTMYRAADTSRGFHVPNIIFLSVRITAATLPVPQSRS